MRVSSLAPFLQLRRVSFVAFFSPCSLTPPPHARLIALQSFHNKFKRGLLESKTWRRIDQLLWVLHEFVSGERRQLLYRDTMGHATTTQRAAQSALKRGRNIPAGDVLFIGDNHYHVRCTLGLIRNMTERGKGKAGRGRERGDAKKRHSRLLPKANWPGACTGSECMRMWACLSPPCWRRSPFPPLPECV